MKKHSGSELPASDVRKLRVSAAGHDPNYMMPRAKGPQTYNSPPSPNHKIVESQVQQRNHVAAALFNAK